MIYELLTVLLIEDSRDDERLALRALRMCGLPLFVRVKRHGAEGLAALGLDGASEGPLPRVPDLIISDLKMPKASGAEVLAKVRANERLRNVPFVIFSSSAEPSDIDRCMALGANAYAVKPIDFREYVECAAELARHWLSASSTKSVPDCVLEESDGNAELLAGVP